MEYGSNEMVTISLERYSRLVSDNESLERHLEALRSAIHNAGLKICRLGHEGVSSEIELMTEAEYLRRYPKQTLDSSSGFPVPPYFPGASEINPEF